MIVGLPLQLEHPRADAGDDSTVDEQVGAVDEGGVFAKQERGGIGNLVAGGHAAGGRGINHGLIAVAVGIELVVGQGRDDDAWRMVLIRALRSRHVVAAARWACRWLTRLAIM